MQVAVQFVEPGPHRQPLAVSGQGTADRAGVGVYEHRARVVGGDVVDRERHLRRLVRRGRRPDAGDGALRMRGADGCQLSSQRQLPVADVVDGEFVPVHRAVDLWDHRVQQPGDGGDQDERRDEQAGVEVQPQQCRADALPRRWIGRDGNIRVG
ncbi:Uncharacterised protein [Mycobacteroides abscessus subsp. abscessus]|nr:Uncharacterised protein [Mycobacteroides abscessus subsp. abscessus]